MKKKFLIFTLCFTLIFSSINYRRSYADGGVISLPVLGVVASVGVASGLVLNNNESLYDLGKSFIDYINSQNDMTWDLFKATFNSSVSVLDNKLISTDSKLLDIIKGFFDSKFLNEDGSSSVLPFSHYKGVPVYENFTEAQNSPGLLVPNSLFSQASTFTYGSLTFNFKSQYSKYYQYTVDGAYVKFMKSSTYEKVNFFKHDNDAYVNILSGDGYSYNIYLGGDVLTPGYYGGVYDNSKVNDKREEDGSIALPIPGNLGDLVNKGYDEFWDNTDNLVGNGDLSIPGVDDPSIGFDDTISFPNAGDTDIPDVDVPGENTWSNITEYIIGLVVPSDSYWTDTFGGLQNNFISSFPMVDMSSFNSLIVDGKPFPNIDIKIMGSGGRIVNGDTVNSIVDWLRPIIAGFVFLCLMFFNYRKLYKLIRNSEPFEGIGKVENHAN